MTVAENFRDLPLDLVPEAIQLQAPAEFAHNTVAIDLAAAVRAAQRLAQRFTRPLQTIDEVLDTLVDRYGFTEAVQLIRSA